MTELKLKKSHFVGAASLRSCSQYYNYTLKKKDGGWGDKGLGVLDRAGQGR